MADLVRMSEPQNVDPNMISASAGYVTATYLCRFYGYVT